MIGIKLQKCEKYVKNFDRKNCRKRTLENTGGRHE